MAHQATRTRGVWLSSAAPLKLLAAVSIATIAASIATVAVIDGVSTASIPDSTGIIHGCYKNHGGQLRVINTTSTSQCPAGTTSLNWTQGVGSAQVQDFRSPGTFGFVDPAGVASVLVEAWGGGGGGGGGGGLTTIPPFINGDEGSYGSPGGYVRALVSVTPGETYSVVVGGGGDGGAGGAAGSASTAQAGANGSLGDTSTFSTGSTQLLAATGGGGGAGGGTFETAGGTQGPGGVGSVETYSPIATGISAETGISDPPPEDGYVGMGGSGGFGGFPSSGPGTGGIGLSGVSGLVVITPLG